MDFVGAKGLQKRGEIYLHQMKQDCKGHSSKNKQAKGKDSSRQIWQKGLM